MPYELKCADTGAECAFACTAQTEDELMQHVQLHASVAHPDMELTPEAVAQVKSLIRTS
jgi:predicted small metal-binding protein